MIWPWLQSKENFLQGTGVDLGCADGEYTWRVSEMTGARMAGIDVDGLSIKRAKELHGDRAVFIEADLISESSRYACKNANFAMSVCCLTHVNDENCKVLISNLMADLNRPKNLVLMVTHQEWAIGNYGDIQQVHSGVTAVPRFGGTQWFRNPEWYIDRFEAVGFVLKANEALLIPNDLRLEQRYLERTGKPLFDTYVFGST